MDSKQLIIRVDDVSPNTDLYDLNRACEFLNKELGAEIWYCVNIFAKKAEGTVYPDLPMRGRGIKYFVDVDKAIGGDFCVPGFVRLASHGLIHAEHDQLPDMAQYISIMISCNILNTKIFVPPFMAFDELTKKNCKANGIEMIDGIDWKSMESYPYDANHKKWYFHHWRMDFEKIKEWVNASKVNV